MLSNRELYGAIFILVAAVATAFAALRCVHMLQLESYQGNMYLKWIRRNGKNEVLACFLSGFIALALHFGWLFFYYTNTWLSLGLSYGADAAYVALMLYIGVSSGKKPAKKPVAFTGRVWRLLAVFVVVAAICHASLFLNLPPNTWGNVTVMLALRYLPGMALPYFVLLAYFVTLPVENGIKGWYYNDAKKKLFARQDLIRIGITGSYGKTSTKFILGTILQEKLYTLVTPGSYNTPMGITRVVREQLQKEHEVFVAEMGARYKGDIQELCELVRPSIGILTSVGKQHLETFGDFETVVATKAELLSGLSEDGAAFLNGDNADCRKLYEACEVKQKFLFGMEGESLFMRAEDVTVGDRGSDFSLVAADGESMRCHTALLGKHNIVNIAGAAAIAKYMGLSMAEIAAGVEKLQPVEHRLQLIEGPVTVIDDAFNANPAGAKAALEVLAAFAPAKRIIVTPGMIELGEEEEALNEDFGREIAHAADIAILVGLRHTEPIRRGLLAEGFSSTAIIQVESLSDASELLPQYTEPGAVVLFENDLPDNYNEF